MDLRARTNIVVAATLPLAATYVGLSQVPGASEADIKSNRSLANSSLCDAFAKNGDFWKSVLEGRKPYPSASLKEERQLIATYHAAGLYKK
jgi:hypothetical protein